MELIMKRVLIVLFLFSLLPVLAVSPYQIISTNSNTLYINPNGTDSTAAKGRSDLPYKSIDSAKAAATLGDAFEFSSGQFVFTNVWVLLNGQSVVGQGPLSTFLVFAGNDLTGIPGAWTGIELATNNYVAGFSISATNWGASRFAACIGGSGAGKGISNAVIDSVWTHGDTDNFYVDNHGHLDATLVNCRLQSAWDTVAITSCGNDSHLRLVNCISINLGPSVSNPSAGAVCLRNGGASPADATIYGGDMTSSGVIISGGKASFFGTQMHTTNSSIWSPSGTGTPLNLNGVNVTPGQVIPTGIAISTGPMFMEGLPVVVDAPLLPFGTGVESLDSCPRAALNQINWDPNLVQMRIFNGIQWQGLAPAMNTNMLVVTGEPDATYNGAYGYHASVVDALPGLSYTNRNGRFFMFTTNANSDGMFGVSATESMISGTEYDTSTGLNPPGIYLFERGWGNTGVRVAFADKSTITSTAIPIGTAFTNNTTKVQMVCGLSTTLVAAAVTGNASVTLELSGVFTNSFASMKTTALTIAGSYTNALPTFIVPVGSRWKFLDSSTGAGNSATLVGGQVQ